MIRHSLVPTVLLTLTACGDLPPGAQPRIEQTDGPEIVLKAGQEIQLRGTPLRIAFLRVIGDSRCPRDVVCVWAGNGAVELELSLGRDPERRVTLNSTVGPRETVLGDYRVSLVELTPDPLSTRPIPPEDYAVRLRVETGS
jgi:hypothetical protein